MAEGYNCCFLLLVHLSIESIVHLPSLFVYVVV